MPTAISSLGLFLRGIISRCYFWLPAVLLDPLDWWNQYLRPDGWPTYSVSTEVFLAVLGTLVLLTAFLTYHDLRRTTWRGTREPNMALHEALRWIAKDSVWAAAYRGNDADWVTAVKGEFLSKWQLGNFEIMGYDRQGNGGLTSSRPR